MQNVAFFHTTWSFEFNKIIIKRVIIKLLFVGTDILVCLIASVYFSRSILPIMIMTSHEFSYISFDLPL